MDGKPISRDTFSAFLGVFTDNLEVRKGKTVQYSSQLNLKQAVLAIKGHRTLSSVGLKTFKQIQTQEEHSLRGVESSALEDSAGTAVSPFLESKLNSSVFGKRKTTEAKESPTINSIACL
jgi:hypothetical protein